MKRGRRQPPTKGWVGRGRQCSVHSVDGRARSPPAGSASAAIFLSTSAKCRSPSRSTRQAARSSCRTFCSPLILRLPPHRTVTMGPHTRLPTHLIRDSRKSVSGRSPTTPAATALVQRWYPRDRTALRPQRPSSPQTLQGHSDPQGHTLRDGTRGHARSCPAWHPCVRLPERRPPRSRKRPGSLRRPGADLGRWPGR